MKIRAIEVEVDGEIRRYRCVSAEESRWASPEGFKYGKPEESKYKAVGTEVLCECGHFLGDHLPECIYKVEGCECVGYEEAKSGG